MQSLNFTTMFMFRRVGTLMIVLLLSALMVQIAAQEETPEPVPTSPSPDEFDVQVLVPEILSVRPHDTGSFTQGLLLHTDGFFYESDGGSVINGDQSSLRRVDPQTGEVLQQVDLLTDYFAEGLALVDDRLIQLTWRSNFAIVYERETFEPVEIFQYSGEGWGLCYDGSDLYMSDGSSRITRRDSQTFQPLGSYEVTLYGIPVEDLNELECVGDHVYANVWQTDTILQIDKFSGVVTAVIDASDLLTDAERSQMPSSATLNGIAYDPENEVFFITGKLWAQMFEVRFIPAAGE